MKKIKFPKKEYLNIKKRIEENRIIFTLRISKEQGKYEEGEILESPFGKLAVIDVKTIKKVASYKYFHELTDTQIRLLKRYDLIDVIKLKKIPFQIFTYYENKEKKTINVKICKSFWSKLSGLMFRKKSPQLLFIFNKEKILSIHSFFCKPFTAIWLNKNKKITKKMEVNKWLPSISGNGKYLLEILKK